MSYDEYMDDEYGDYQHHVWGADEAEASTLADDYESYSDLADPHALYTHCLLPTLETAGLQLGETLALVALYRALLSLNVVRSSGVYRNYANLAVGLAILYRYFENLLVHIGAYSLCLFLLVVLVQRYRYGFQVTLAFSIATITLCEYALPGFIQIRSVFMLMSIKLLSVLADFKSDLPLSFDLIAYLYNPGTVLFGPWVSYKQFLDSMEKPTPLQPVRIGKHILYTGLYLAGTCLVMVFPTGGLRLAFVYRDALSFRVSHYFISAMSVVTFLVSGFHSEHAVPVANPLYIELPYSLKLVTTNWNRPLSHFLNKYIFSELHFRNMFVNLFITYVVSCGLHGFNLYIAQILLSLSVYTYLEFKLRAKLASVLDACVSGTVCPVKCLAHAHNVLSLRGLLVNSVFVLLNVYHLAYLGCVLSGMDVQQGLMDDIIPVRWSNLGYVSPYIMFGVYIFYIVI